MMRATSISEKKQKSDSISKSGSRKTRLPVNEVLANSIIQAKGCSCGGTCPKCSVQQMAQPKLKISAFNDKYEQEADRMVNHVMQSPTVNNELVSARNNVVISRNSMSVKPQTKQDFASAIQMNENTENGISSLNSGGKRLPGTTRTFFESRMGADFNDVRIHTGAAASEAAQSINARAYTMGKNIVFNENEYSPESHKGKRLLAHELTHTMQQQKNTIRREPLFPDKTCQGLEKNIKRAWPTAKKWISLAKSLLQDPVSVSGALQRHFKIDPNNSSHAGDLAMVIRNFNKMDELINKDIDNRCTPPNKDQRCQLDGRYYAAYVPVAGKPADGIYHCTTAADVGLVFGGSLIDTIVHEIAHIADSKSTDYSYRHKAVVTSYAKMTRQQSIHNGDSYSEFAKELFFGNSRDNSFSLNLSTGLMLATSTTKPRWVIMAGSDLRSRTGLEVFDLIGGYRLLFSLDQENEERRTTLRDLGFVVDIGVLSRSPKNKFFVDTRVGFMFSGNLSDTSEASKLGISASAVIGWANNGFRSGINMRLLYDVLNKNHTFIIGGEFNIPFL